MGEAVALRARFTHTNLIARDWRRLASFYEEVFGCTPVPPERDQSGDWLDAGTGLSGARLRGAHLRLPGHGPDGPTLEVYQYDREEEPLAPAANRPGFTHIAFAVDDVAAARDAVIAAGGKELGKLSSVEVPGIGTITFIYVADPEGNLIELQRCG